MTGFAGKFLGVIVDGRPPSVNGKENVEVWIGI
jgi:hypothetical protein